MPFNSLEYFFFLPVTWLIFLLSPQRWRWLVLLFASLGFYWAHKAYYLLLTLGFVAAASYYVGVKLGKTAKGNRNILLWQGIFANLLVLVLLKYLPSLLTILHVEGGYPFQLGSIGVSFFVFQAISYLVDIYLEKIDPEPSFGYLFLSLAFFPKLLQGPIERSGDLLPQLHAPYCFRYGDARRGALLFLWGLFKKVVVADRLALYTSNVYGNVHAFSGLPLLLATYMFAFEIYLDFSAYTDMALGAARLFGVRLTQNFRNPYGATSIAEFWRRWHITFSQWLLDYIFKPLQVSWRRYGTGGVILALMFTFVFSGLWHGVTWGFLVWGILHGLYLTSSFLYRPLQKRIHALFPLMGSGIHKLVQLGITFHLVAFSWIFFRAASLSDAVYVVTHLFRPSTSLRTYLLGKSNSTELLITILSLSVVAGVGLVPAKADLPRLFSWPGWFRWAVYCLLLLGTSLLYFDKDRPFIYLQF